MWHFTRPQLMCNFFDARSDTWWCRTERPPTWPERQAPSPTSPHRCCQPVTSFVLDIIITKTLKCQFFQDIHQYIQYKINIIHIIYIYILIIYHFRFVSSRPSLGHDPSVLFHSVLAHWCFIQAKWANQGVHHKSAARAFTKVKQILALSCQCKWQHPNNSCFKRISQNGFPPLQYSFPSLSWYFFRSKPAK